MSKVSVDCNKSIPYFSRDESVTSEPKIQRNSETFDLRVHVRVARDLHMNDQQSNANIISHQPEREGIKSVSSAGV